MPLIEEVSDADDSLSKMIKDLELSKGNFTYGDWRKR
jgi:hypothetical protein